MGNGNFGDDADKTAVIGLKDLDFLRDDHKQRSAYLVTIKGRNVGRMHKITEDHTVVGRSSSCGVVIDDEGISRHHARIERELDSYVLMDNNSTNGVFVNGDRVGRHLLQDGDRVQVGCNTILKFSFTDAVEESFQKQLYDSATLDALTGAYNKKYFAEQLKTKFAYCYRHRVPLSLILFDIDHFKKLNDGFGHVAGDFALKTLAQVVQQALRTEDIFARYGGEEFGIILRGTDPERAFLTAERVRRSIEAHDFVFEGQTLTVTISAGVATLLERNLETPKDLVKTADQYLYQAKHHGRNRTESALM